MIKDYFKELETLAEYNAFITTSIKPNVSWVAENNSVHYGNELSGHTINIIGIDNVIGETLELSVLYDNKRNITSSCTWTIVSGNEFATVGSNGTIFILSGASASSITVRAAYQTLTDTKTVTVTYKYGTETHTEVEVVTDESGNTTTTTTTTIENADGSSQIESSTVVVDENGNTIGSNETNKNVNSDGSSTSTSTNYDENGDPIDTTNTSGDTSGNINTQNIEYDESGNSIVTGYTIDTSENPSGAKQYNGDGVNTEYYAFDMTEGFIVDFDFTIDFSNQPAGQDENHHNILTAKRATPSPWYGFQLRQSSTNKYIQLGTQFSGGSNVNTTINPYQLTGNTAEYNLRIVYDPTASTNKFVCYDLLRGTTVLSKNDVFPDIEALKYLKVTIGCAMDGNGDPYRYSNINVKDFSIKKLTNVSDPVISCDGEEVSIVCSTANADIYYRLNETGIFLQYSAPIAISADTFVESYAELNGRRSSTVSQNCIYDSGVKSPAISCDGEEITLSCETVGADIFYKLNHAENYSTYSEPIIMSADTFVEAYSELDGKRSAVVSQNCIYNPEHDYSLEYLTFRIISAGTISWTSVASGGTEFAKTIQYSLNDGQWTSIEATTGGTSIVVSDGDAIKFKGTNTTYAVDNKRYSGFSGSTANFNIEGNIMSLVYGDNFVGQTAMTGTYNFCSLFKQSNCISAENLVLPATTLTPYCYRALFANSPSLEVAPSLPSTVLSEGCYRYMFQDTSITTAPDLLAPTLVTSCYEGMFNNCTKLTYIKCLAKDISALSATTAWTTYINTVGTFVKDANTSWTRGTDGIPTKWVIVEEGLKNPDIYCDGLQITITCDTSGSSVYYRLNEEGTFALYSTPISISADTVVEAYSVLDSETSTTVTETCVYDDGIEEPVIYCDGVYITISCETMGADIFYKLNHAANYETYEDAIMISADTFVESYAQIDGRSSEVVSANCIYDDTLRAPEISCDGVEVTITCITPNADIYYRLNEEGNFSQYSLPIEISADTVVEAYSVRDIETSTTVTETCIYNPVHDYSKDYLTFKVLSNGTIKWDSIGSNSDKTIQYSLNNGSWTSILASTATTIPVSAGDSVRFKGTNASYAIDKSNYSGFDSGGTASFNIEGNIMSLVYGDNFDGQTAMTGTYNFCSLFKQSNCISAENLVLPSTALTQYCYRAMFSLCPSLITAPELPAMTLAQGCYWYMFEGCPMTTAPDLPAETLVRECYGNMFINCSSLNYIKALAVSGFTATNCKQNWTKGVASNGTFVKNSSVTTSTWSTGINGIPTSWLVYDDVSVDMPVINCDGYNNVTITCDTQGAGIYYKLNQAENYSSYSAPFVISATTFVESYAELDGQESRVVAKTCEYISDVPIEASNRDLTKWNYNNTEVTTPYSVNALDGHSASYAKGTFNFETEFGLREAQPTYLWFQHADQSATIYVNDTLVEKHWGGYAAFFVDITNYVHSGTNRVKVALKNNEGNNLAPASGDFNFNATLGNVKLFTSPVLPSMEYGYDGFHVTSDVATSSATINVRTKIPTGATVVCTIDDGTYHYSDSGNSTEDEMLFTAIVQNPHLWNGKLDPHLYNITLEIYHDGDLYHRYQRPYGLRYYEYVINETVNNETYTGFLLNGSPYFLRGCCMHDDIKDKANALNDNDYTQTFSIIQELGCNFLRLAHYPHPKEVYDWCDRLGIIVQTEAPCVNKFQSTMPADYYDHLNTQYDDMVNQHYNHPCIMFWGLSNETTTDDKEFAKTKINGYIARIKKLDSERMVGYVLAQSASDPSSYYNNPDADWFGGNIYEGWYSNKDSNNPTSALNTRVRNIITNKSKAFAYSEYGCGGTQRCHSDEFMTTTTRGNYERHDIEYMMWLHEGHIAAIKNFPQLLFTSQWQLFDIAVSNRNEGYTVCLDGENTSTDEDLRRLNDKGLVERDHVTKKDTFYLYKAWWNPTTPFVHICGKDYTKKTDRTIKCYTNDGNNLSLYVNNNFVETVSVTDNIATFTTTNFSSGDIIRVDGNKTTDTFTFE